MNNGHYFCNLVIPGFAKCGTTSLHAMLGVHPRIQMSRIKEPHHFAKDEHFAGGSVAHNALFAPSNKVVWYGEASTIYCISDKARQRIRACLDTPKLIFLLREPIARLLSHYRWMTRLGYENRPLGEAIEEDGFGFDPERDIGGNYRAYMQFSQYATYLPPWLEIFGTENVLILRSEALKADQIGQLRRCTDFLGLPKFREVPQAELNVTDTLRRQKLPSWISSASRMLPAGLREHQSYSRLSTWVKQLAPPVDPPKVTAAELIHLRKLLVDDIAYFNDIAIK